MRCLLNKYFPATSSGGIIRIRCKGRRFTFLSACHTSSPVYLLEEL